jgi:hypothetical protein
MLRRNAVLWTSICEEVWGEGEIKSFRGLEASNFGIATFVSYVVYELS